jgi:hypothetical protein
MLKLPEECTVERMVHLYMRLVKEKYPNDAKIMSILKELGLDLYPPSMKIIVLQQFRDMLHETAPSLLDHKQRDKLLHDAIIPALEDLENELQDFEEYLEVRWELEENKKETK